MSARPETEPVLFAVASRLKAAESRSRFIALSQDLAGWLAARPGFLRYELYETETGWLDTMLWRDQASADAGNRAFAETPLCADFMAIVSTDYSSHSGRAFALHRGQS